MGVRVSKSVDTEKLTQPEEIVLKGRVSYISDVDTYKVMGHGDDDIDNYNNFIYTSTGDKPSGMFGSPYKITIIPTPYDNAQYRVNTINGATIESLQDSIPCVSITFNRVIGVDIGACVNILSTLTLIVPAGSPIVKTFGLGDYAKIDLSIVSHREDALC